jgi:hypothetical protein
VVGDQHRTTAVEPGSRGAIVPMRSTNTAAGEFLLRAVTMDGSFVELKASRPECPRSYHIPAF